MNININFSNRVWNSTASYNNKNYETPALEKMQEIINKGKEEGAKYEATKNLYANLGIINAFTTLVGALAKGAKGKGEGGGNGGEGEDGDNGQQDTTENRTRTAQTENRLEIFKNLT